MSLQRYANYKDSGVEWLEKIPAHWTIMRLRQVVSINPSKQEINHLDRATEVSFLPMEAIGDDGSISLERTRPISEVETGYTYFRDGDVSLAKITPCFENGKGAIMSSLVGGIGFGTTELIVARPHTNRISSAYLHRVFTSWPFRRMGEAAMYGAGGQKRVPDDFIRNFSIGIPPREEQVAITTFLDRETAKIDALIAEQEKLIALLAEKRQATISHAVTSDKTHWTRMAIKHALHGIIDTEHKTAPFYDDGQFLVVRTSNVKNGTLVWDDAKYTDKASFEEWTRRGIPEPGDIIFTREAPAGEACIVPSGVPLCLGQRTVLMKINREKLHPQFALYSLYGGLASEFIANLSQGSTVAHFNMSDIGNIPLLVPPLEEQHAIAAYLDKKAAKFDALRDEAQRAVVLLKERRSALITAAVTGQIDVRNLTQEIPA